MASSAAAAATPLALASGTGLLSASVAADGQVTSAELRERGSPRIYKGGSISAQGLERQCAEEAGATIERTEPAGAEAALALPL